MVDIIRYLQGYPIQGYAIVSAIVVITYLIISLLCIRACRKRRYDICATGFIPVVNIIIVLVVVVKSNRLDKILNTEIEI